ncbi:MAG: endonuclease V [Proteobacteria bacterium]|nr:endonuclease V [Pseudomonadota bacterium]
MEQKIHHPWKVSVEEARLIQERLRERLFRSPTRRRFRWVGSGDVAYTREDDRLFGAMVVLSLPDMTIVDQAWHVGRVDFPYIPGYLSFRECPILLEVAKKIRRAPDVWIFDGQGIAHPKGIGLASHMGLLLDCPSVGCAKTRLIGNHCRVGLWRGDFEVLMLGKKTIGAVVRTRHKTKPLYVSPGFRIDLQGAVNLVLETCTRYRIPEPLRQAHLLSHRIRRQNTQ